MPGKLVSLVVRKKLMKLARIRREEKIYIGAVVDDIFLPLIDETNRVKLDIEDSWKFDYEELLIPVTPSKIVIFQIATNNS